MNGTPEWRYKIIKVESQGTVNINRQIPYQNTPMYAALYQTKYALSNYVDNAVWYVGTSDTTNDLTNGYNQEKKATFVGKIGALSASDYAYASLQGNGKNYISNVGQNWMYVTNDEWMMTSHVNNYVKYLANQQTISNYGSYNMNYRPVVYLNPDILITGGSGTASDPYVFEGKKSVITFDATEGELANPSEKTRTIAYKGIVGQLPIGKVRGKVIEGWYTDKTYATKIKPTDRVSGDAVTYYAKWVDSNAHNYFESAINLNYSNIKSDRLEYYNNVIKDVDGNYRFKGTSNNVNNYITFEGDLFRIIGAFNVATSLNGTPEWRYKIIRVNSLGTININRQIPYQNTPMYTALSQTKYALSNYVDNAVWYVGTSDTTNDLTNGYNQEKRSTFVGKIGALSASDYAYASLDGNGKNYISNVGQNWMYATNDEWMMTSHVNNYVKYLQNQQTISNYGSYNMNYRPVVYLKSNILITGGSGTLTDPYVFVDETNNSNSSINNDLGNKQDNIIYMSRVEIPEFKIGASDEANSKYIEINFKDNLINQYSLDYGQTWNNYTQGINVTENTIIIARSIDEGGNVITSSSFTITKIVTNDEENIVEDENDEPITTTTNIIEEITTTTIKEDE